jgi:hypothetical protein
MRLDPALVRSVLVDRQHPRLLRIAVIPGARVPWRPPLRLHGVLEHLRRPIRATA